MVFHNNDIEYDECFEWVPVADEKMIKAVLNGQHQELKAELAQCMNHIKCSSEYRLFEQLTEAFLSRHMANRVPEPIAAAPVATMVKTQTVPNLAD